MKISKKPRHWIPIVIGVATVFLALAAFFDLFGDSPEWITGFAITGALLTTTLGIMNVQMDRKEKEGARE